jgi:hypothetical protein
MPVLVSGVDGVVSIDDDDAGGAFAVEFLAAAA